MAFGVGVLPRRITRAIEQAGARVQLRIARGTVDVFAEDLPLGEPAVIAALAVQPGRLASPETRQMLDDLLREPYPRDAQDAMALLDAATVCLPGEACDAAITAVRQAIEMLAPDEEAQHDLLADIEDVLGV